MGMYDGMPSTLLGGNWNDPLAGVFMPGTGLRVGANPMRLGQRDYLGR